MNCPFFNKEGIISPCFTVDPSQGDLSTEFMFTTSCTTFDVNCTVAVYHWSFGDGEKESTTNSTITHQYAAAGYYSVTLDSITCKLSPEKSGNQYIDYVTVVDPSGNEAPDAEFTFSPPEGPPGTIFSFDASGCTDKETPDEDLQVRWDFNGDGSWDTDYSIFKTTQQQFDGVGSFNTTLQVKDADDATDQITKEVPVVAVQGEPCPGLPKIEYMGQEYNTVQIDNQCWLRENLNVGSILNSNQQQTDNGTIEKYCYDNIEANCEKYGGLYLWNEMLQYQPLEIYPTINRGICPEGWHIPNQLNEWDEVVVDLGGSEVAGGKLKSLDLWLAPNTGATNITGFTALPGGWYDVYDEDVKFKKMGEEAHFWAAEWGLAGVVADVFQLKHNSAETSMDDGYPNQAMSVRCIKNSE